MKFPFFKKKTPLSRFQVLWKRQKALCVLLFLIVIIGVIYLLPHSEKKADLAAQQVMRVAENIRKFYQTKPNYWGLQTNYALRNGLFQGLRIQNNVAFHSLGGKVYVGQGVNGDVVMPGENGFDVIYPDINRIQCIALLAHKFSDEQNLGLQHIAVFDEKGILIAEFGWSGLNRLPIHENMAENICMNNNFIVWSFE